MAAASSRRVKTVEEPVELSLPEIAVEPVLERFRKDLRNIGVDLEMFENRLARPMDLGSLWTLPTSISGGIMGPVDLEDTGTDYAVRVDLPGAKKDDIVVRFLDQTLDVRAEKEKVVEAHKKNYVYRGRTEESYSRRVSFPTPVRTEKAEAKLVDGVLTVTVPKVKPEKELRVQIE